MPDKAATSLEIAAQHVAEARRVVEQQRQRIAKLKKAGKPTSDHEQTLRVLETTLQIFEDDERRIRGQLGR